jgi:translation initiation factor 1
MCPGCGRPVAACVCREQKDRAIPQGDGIVRVSRETKGRKGKGVTLIAGVPLDQPGLQRLAKQLKRKCGAGGTVKDRTIEVQGDHRDLLLEELRARGYTVKRAGG